MCEFRETNASEPPMRPRNRSTDGIRTGAPPLSGRSMAETWLLAMRCPGYRWRDSGLGSGPELENLFSGAQGEGTSGSPQFRKRFFYSGDALWRTQYLRAAFTIMWTRFGPLASLADGRRRPYSRDC